MRAFLQALSLFLFTLLFIFAAYGLPEWLPADLYLRLDPLLTLSALLAKKEYIARALWSIIIVGATIFIGRFFCGYVCPLGVTIDLGHFFFWRKIKFFHFAKDKVLRRLKFYLLLITLSAALGGLTISALFDPIPILTRFYTFTLYPLVITIFNLILDILRPLSTIFGWSTLQHSHYAQPVYYMSLITFLIFGLIIFLNRYASRFWCRYLCPLGALLSLISPLGVFKRRVNQNCTSCLKCQKSCPMGAVAVDPRQTHFSECIQCRTCAQVCPEKAISFLPKLSSSIAGEHSSPDFSRREFLYGIPFGLVLAFLTDRTPYTPLQGKSWLIRPPGAIPEDEFLKTCIRCGECMKSCVTNTLQPSLWESGLAGLWTPKLDLRFAACEQNCNICGQVCPTQAIRALSLEEKNHAKIGTAVLRREMCLVWAENKICLICDEICPYNAIVFRTIEGFRRPVVIPSKCNGCGWCEQKCPIQGESAIVVVPMGEIRLKEGSYIKEAKRRQLEFKPDPGDDKYILEQSGLEAGKESSPAATKPKGFL